MLVIRPEQMAVLEQTTEDIFQQRLLAFLRQQYPPLVNTDTAVLSPIIREQVARARGYKLISERQVATYVTTSYLLGRRFDEHYQEAQAKLKAPCPAEDKAAWLRDWCPRMLASQRQTR